MGYQVTCLICRDKGVLSTYQGETGQNGLTRGRKHLKDLKNKVKSSGLVAHMSTTHPGEPHNFKFEVIKAFKDPLSRQIEEAKRIEASGVDPTTMNQRSEWRSTPLPRMGFTQGRVPEGCTPTFQTQGAQNPVVQQPGTNRRPGVLHREPGVLGLHQDLGRQPGGPQALHQDLGLQPGGPQGPVPVPRREPGVRGLHLDLACQPGGPQGLHQDLGLQQGGQQGLHQDLGLNTGGPQGPAPVLRREPVGVWGLHQDLGCQPGGQQGLHQDLGLLQGRPQGSVPPRDQHQGEWGLHQDLGLQPGGTQPEIGGTQPEIGGTSVGQDQHSRRSSRFRKEK